MAWLAAPAALAAKLEMAKQAGGLCSPAGSTSAIIYEACRRGVLDRQLPMLRSHYAHKRDVMERRAAKRELGQPVTWPKPRGGFFLWADAAARGSTPTGMIPRAVEHGVIYVAGDAFYVNGEGHNTLRLSFSAPTPERIREGVRRLAAAVGDEVAALGSASASVPAIP